MKHLKMRSKLIGLFAITGLIPMIVISLLLLTNATKQIESDVMDKTQFYFHLVEDRIADYYAQREGDGRILASVGDVSKGLLLLQEYSSGSAEWKEQYQLIEHFTKVSVDENDFLDIFLTDTSGNIVLSTEFKDDLENANVSHRTYLQTSLSGNQNWSPLFFSDFIYLNCKVKCINFF